MKNIQSHNSIEQAVTQVLPDRKKLRVGLLLDSYDVPAWSHQMISDILASHYAEIVLLVVSDDNKDRTVSQNMGETRGRPGSVMVRNVLEFVYEKLIARDEVARDPDLSLSSKDLLQNVTAIEAEPLDNGSIVSLRAADVEAISQHSVDVLVKCGFGNLTGEVLNCARFGIWSLEHGDNLVHRGGPAGFWESMEGKDETGSVLRILGEDPDNGTILYRSFSCTDPMSVQGNKSNYYWKTVSFMTRKLQELYESGEDKFFEKVEYENRHPKFYSERHYGSPKNTELARLLFIKVVQKIRLLIGNALFLNQWGLLFQLSPDFSSALWRYQKIVPPMDRFWADPHVIFRDNKYYIFIEEYFFNGEKGHISVITMEPDGQYSEPEIVLDEPFHLSYPFVFEHDNRTYMVPESMDNRTIGLYECVGFPNRWELKKNLMENIDAVDATLYRHNGKWWLFANVVEARGASSWDELCIFYSDDLLGDTWQPHPMNPVVSDCKSARPAGKLFSKDGRLYRPSQNCSKSYGYGFNLCEITTLDEHTYAEEVVSRVVPNWEKGILGTHTFNREHHLHVTDVLRRRFKFLQRAD